MYSLIVLFTLVLCIFFFNIYRKNTPMSSKGEEYDKYYVLISDDSDSDFWNKLCWGATEYGLQNRICVKNLGDDFSEDYNAEQLMRIAIASKVDGIIVDANDSDEMKDLINEAQKSGIPVVTTRNDCANSNRISYVGIVNYNLGKKIGILINGIIKNAPGVLEGKDDINVVVLMDSAPTADQSLIFSGVQERLREDSDGGKNITTTAVNVNDSNTFSVEESVRELFVSGDSPDIIACLTENETNFAAQAALDYNKVGDVRIIGYYDSLPILKSIDRGIVDCSIRIDAKNMGVTCVDVLIRYSETGYLNQFNTVGIDVINKSNVAFYLEAENENEIQ